MAKEIHNLIILDKSGSMSSIVNQTIAGINETVGSIKAAGRDTDTIQRVTITTFCGCDKSDICTDVPVDKVPLINHHNYSPCCSTPLYDAMGSALTRLRNRVKDQPDTAVSVTIITDGYENSSKEWSGAQIKALVELLKADGWLFAYIGANQDSKEVSFNLSIDNSMDFDASPEGTNLMFSKECKARSRWLRNVACDCNMSTGYFDDLDNEDD